MTREQTLDIVMRRFDRMHRYEMIKAFREHFMPELEKLETLDGISFELVSAMITRDERAWIRAEFQAIYSASA